MSAGVYRRTPAMKTYGKTAGKRGDILYYRQTHSLTQTAKEFGITVSTVCKLQSGNWNVSRKRKINGG